MGLDKCIGSIQTADDGKFIEIGVPAGQCLTVPLSGGLVTALQCTLTQHIQLSLDLSLPFAHTLLLPQKLSLFHLEPALSDAQTDLWGFGKVGEGGSGLWAFLEAPEDDAIELHRVGKFLGSGFLDEPDAFELIAGSEGRLQGTEFIDETPQCPYICLFAANPTFDLFGGEVMCLWEDSGSQFFLALQSFAEIESPQFQVLPGGLSEVDMCGVQIAMQDAIIVNILQCLCQLVKDAPNLLLRQSFPLRPCNPNQILQCPSTAILHDDIHSDILLIDGVVEVPKDVDVIESYEGVDFVDDVLFAFGREGAEGDLLEHHLPLRGERDRLEEVQGLLRDYLVAGLHSNDTFQIQQLQSHTHPYQQPHQND